MFYSQFILAKKGPLGTIWIAAHLERKLRKNQVADTDIGVSVDSILSPDVPIALRLSSHLLLGVVRIYSRKVNYLFDDCSEALLKVKQAFRSAAVDLPPEESKAPYHSITLPETFELDDFELPDNDIFHGNSVDHHISSREQITLQDTLDGATYSTSKFGLDERFGDGDASGLDLDEELFLGKVDAAGLVNERSDPQSSVGPMTPLKQEEHSEMRTVNSGIRADVLDDYADLMEYAQAPCTPGLVEEPNLPKVQEVSACDDHMESECHLGESMLMKNAKTNIYENKEEVNWSSHNNEDSDGVPMVLPEEYGHHSGGLNMESSKPLGEIPVEADTELILDMTLSRSEPHSDSVGLGKSLDTSLELAHKIVGASHVSCMEDLQNGVLPVDENDLHQAPYETGFVNSACEISGLVSTYHQDEPRIHETQVSNEPGEPSSLNLDVHEKVAPSGSSFIRPCTNMEQPHLISGRAMSAYAAVQSDVTDLETSGREETVMIDKARSGAYNSEENLENHMQEGINAASNKPDSQVTNASAHGIPADNWSNFAEANLPAPEKLLSVSEDIVNHHNNMLPEISPGEFVVFDASDAASKVISGKKRSFTESILTEQSLNSVESSRVIRFKRTTEPVPDDDDLLSSILVGRSSVLKVKSSPRPSEVASMKRTRSAPRTGASKRKFIMDDTMVLHGDMIRQQLTNSEDIRRVRKKAPCTQSEISVITNKNLEDEFFVEPLFTGMSMELVSLHSHMWDFSGIQIRNNDLNDSSLEIENVADLRLPSENDIDAYPETTGAPISCPDGAKNEDSLTTAVEPCSTSHAENRDSLDLESGSGGHNVAEQSGEKISIELLSDRDSETAKPSESPMLTNDGINEVREINIEVNTCNELSQPNGDVDADISRQEPKFDTLAGVSDELPCATLDSDKGQPINGDLVTAMDGEGDLNGVYETETLVRNDIFTEVGGEGGSVELLSSSKEEFSEMHSGRLAENIENPWYAAAAAQDDDFRESELSREQPETHHDHHDAESGGLNLNLHEEEEWMLSAAGNDNDNDNYNYNDTEFLNVDDDELNEMGEEDEDEDEDEETRFMEKTTGWSSRTRAVCKYVERMLEGRESVSLENVLFGKSRKEASRMFFETLVLKTRDYIHVEQQLPFAAIAIKLPNSNHS